MGVRGGGLGEVLGRLVAALGGPRRTWAPKASSNSSAGLLSLSSPLVRGNRRACDRWPHVASMFFAFVVHQGWVLPLAHASYQNRVSHASLILLVLLMSRAA